MKLRGKLNDLVSEKDEYMRKTEDLKIFFSIVTDRGANKIFFEKTLNISYILKFFKKK